MTARSYRDTVVDLTGTTKRDATARGILRALRVGVDVAHEDVDREIVAAGGDPGRKAEAIKGLRNLGYAVATTKRRHLSTYRLDATPAEYEDFTHRVMSECYSQQVTTCRTLAGAVASATTDVRLAAAHTQVTMAALALGTQVGKSITQVMNDVAVLT